MSMSKVIVKGEDKIAIMTGGVFTLETSIIAGVKSETLLKSPAALIAKWLKDNSLANEYNNGTWPVFISITPDSKSIPHNCITVYDTSPAKDARSMTGTLDGRFGIQIKVRSIDYETGYKKAEDVGAEIDTILQAGIELDDEEYVIYNASRSTPVTYIGLEQGTKRRYFFVVNFLVKIKRVLI